LGWPGLELAKPRKSQNRGFSCVVAFDTRTLKKLRTYKFSYTYDSSPLVFQTKDGSWLVIAHERRSAGRGVDKPQDI